MVAPLNWLSALITTDCLLPRVVSEMLALNPAALATTWKLPSPPRPWRLPLMLRLISLQVPEIAPPSATTLAAEIEFVAVAGAGQGLVEAVPAFADRIGRAAADALARAVVERDGAAAGPVAGQAGERARLGVACGAERGRREQGDGREDQPPDDDEDAGRPACRYCRDASHRPLHGMPADAPFHFPDPALPLS